MFRDIYKAQESCNPDTTDAEHLLGDIPKGYSSGLPGKNSDFDLMTNNKKGFHFGKNANFLNLAADPFGAYSARKRISSQADMFSGIELTDKESLQTFDPTNDMKFGKMPLLMKYTTDEGGVITCDPESAQNTTDANEINSLLFNMRTPGLAQTGKPKKLEQILKQSDLYSSSEAEFKEIGGLMALK